MSLTKYDIDFIKSREVFVGCELSSLNTHSSGLEVTTINKGMALFKQGDISNSMYFVLHGRLLISVNSPNADGHDLDVAEIGSGEPVGEIQVLSGGKRTANAYALSDTRLVSISRPLFEELAGKNPKIVQRIADIASKRIRIRQLATILPRMLGPIDDVAIRGIESQLEGVGLKRNERLYKQGDPGNSFYIVVIGRLRAYLERPNNNNQFIADISPGEFVGEMSIFSGEPRSASIYAIRNTELVKLSKPIFDKISKQYPESFRFIVNLLIERLQKTYKKTNKDQTQWEEPTFRLSRLVKIYRSMSCPSALSLLWKKEEKPYI